MLSQSHHGRPRSCYRKCSLAPRRHQVTIMCDKDLYLMDRNKLAGESDWFSIACNLHAFQRKGYITFPPEKAKYIKALVRYLQNRTYAGPIPERGRRVPSWERNSNTPASSDSGCTIHFRTNSSALLERFPELRDVMGWTIHGEAAVKACKVITHHADSQSSTVCISSPPPATPATLHVSHHSSKPHSFLTSQNYNLASLSTAPTPFSTRTCTGAPSSTCYGI
ncbi:hypothetical protein K491DRAFT_292686 [Lophiostoma macrostomum CBS 122681]|uniref:Uncharacterized protein n=1 Tax=Lophiostoma macrostomum CBS 122681 TaxID=1314788 RepID=A0A6A6SNA3_9PLEO|nr:hypothetical protein K491DRAFT_292686 [Lophiostoma macrostomum CBS 122681]